MAVVRCGAAAGVAELLAPVICAGGFKYSCGPSAGAEPRATGVACLASRRHPYRVDVLARLIAPRRFFPRPS